MASDDTRHFSMAELIARRERGDTHTRADAPAFAVDEGFWENARLIEPKARKQSA